MLVFLIGNGGGKYILVSPDAVNAPSEAEEYCIGLVPVIHEERTHLLFRGIQKFKRLIIVILFYDVKNILIAPCLFRHCIFSLLIKKQISDTLDDGVLDFELKIMFPAGGSLIKGEMLHGGLHGFHHDKHIKPKFIIRKQFC